MSLGDAQETFPPSSPTSLPLDLSHAPTLASLPTELLKLIIETFFEYDSVRERKADLARLCLVNKGLRLIAQPILFRIYHLEIMADYDSTTPEQLKSFRGGGRLAESIQTLKISFAYYRRGYLSPDSYLAGFPEFLSTLVRLQTVRTSSISSRSLECITLLPQIASRQPLLQHLELPNADLDGLSLLLIASSFPHLQTLVVNLPSLDFTLYLILRPAFHLRRLVVTKFSDSTVLSRLLSSSLASIRSLSLFIDETMEDVVSMPELENLHSLNIVVSGPDRAFSTFATNADAAIRHHLIAIFDSARHLPIKEVAISAKFSCAVSFNSFLRKSLPTTLESLTFGPTNHESFDWLSLVPQHRPRPYSSLKKLSIVPFKHRTINWFMRGDRKGDTERHFGVKDFHEEYGVELDWIAKGEDARFDTRILDAPRVLNGFFDEDKKDHERDVRAEAADFEESMFEKYGW